MEYDPNPYVIFTYIRKQAIEDGVLVDITEFARNYDFVIQIAITVVIHIRFIRPSEKFGQSPEARLDDVLMDNENLNTM